MLRNGSCALNVAQRAPFETITFIIGDGVHAPITGPWMPLLTCSKSMRSSLWSLILLATTVGSNCRTQQPHSRAATDQ